MGTGLVSGTSAQAQAAASRFPFEPIPAQTDFTVHVPEGYSWDILVRWGDPLFEGVEEFDHSSGGTVENSDKVFGENTDGMESFLYDGRQLLAINHEYTNRNVNLPHSDEGVPRDE